MKTKMRKFLAYMLVLMLMSADLAAIAEAVVEGVKTLTLPAALDVIEEEAFYGNTSIDKVVVPYGTTEIRSRAFADSSLTEIELPDTLKFIADDAFDGCSAFVVSVQEGCYAYEWAVKMGHIEETAVTPEEYFVTTELDDGTLAITGYTGENTAVVIPDKIDGIKVTMIGESAFESQNLTSVVIPDGVTVIGDYAFGWNWGLESAPLPDSLKEIGNYAFNQCNLQKIELPEGLLSIGEGAFGGNGNVGSVHIPASVISIGGGVFYDCYSMESVTLDTDNAAYEIVDDVLLSMDGETLLIWLPTNIATEYDVPDGVIEIADNAFNWAEDLTKIALSESLEIIGDCAFQNCSELQDFVIPDSCTTIEGNAFSGCASLTEVVLPEGIEQINWAVFSNCTSLTNVVLPQSVTRIDGMAFADCTSLESINLPDGIGRIEESAFENCPNLTAAVVEGSYAYSWCEANDIDMNVTAAPSIEITPAEYFTTEILDDETLSITGYTGENTFISIPGEIDGMKVTKIGYEAFESQNFTKVEIPEGVTIIDGWAFNWCESLWSVTLPSTLKEIGEYAFNCCNISNVDLHEGLEIIGDGVFSGNENLKSLSIPASVTSIGGGFVSDCYALESVTLADGNPYYEVVDDVIFSTDGTTLLLALPMMEVSVYAVPEGVTEIARNAFENKEYLEEISLPESLETIGNNAFVGCWQLNCITIPSCSYIGDGAFSNCSSLTEIIIPEGVETLEYATFFYCTSLEKVTLSQSITHIWDSVFYECSALTSVNLPENIEYIDELAFEECQNVVATVVEGSYAHEWCAENGVEFVTDGVSPLPTNIPTVRPTVEPTSPPDEDEDLEFTYEVIDEEYVVITGYLGTATSIEIPSTVEGMEVREIGMNAFRNATIESVVLPDTLVTLQQYAFYGCEALTSIDFPESLKTIGYGAFYECTNLESVLICEGVETIEAYAFYNTSITGMDLPDSLLEIGQDAFEGCTDLTEITIPEQVTVIPGHLFRNCTSLKKVVLPEKLTTINYWAFNNCSALEELTIPESANNINAGAFDGCEKLVLKVVEGSYAHQMCVTNELEYELIGEDAVEYLEWSAEGAYADIIGYTGEPVNLVIPEYIGEFKVLSISNDAFSGCSSLESVSIPDGVTYIGQNAFYGCENLKTVTIPDSVNYISGHAFYGCSSLINIALPDRITSIGNAVFYNCSSLMSVDIPDSVTVIATVAFSGCSSLQDISIPANVTLIGDGAFSGCSSLTEIEISDGVCAIGDGAFDGCSSLVRMEIPDSVAEMGKRVFWGCSSLTNVVLPDKITSIEYGTFYGCSELTSVNMPEGITEIGDSAFEDCGKLENITIPDGVVSLGKEAFSGCSSLKNVSIPEGVSQIGDQTFWGCRSLTGIDIPDSVTSIGIRAFCACKSLTSVTVPDKVTYIGDDAFVNCSGLVNVILPDSVDYYGDRVFSGCTSLVSLAIPKGATKISNEEFYDITALVSITIPDGVESVGKDAFYNCVNLTKVVLPDSIDSIGDYAFWKCSNLQTVVMPENAEYIGESAFRECSKLTRISIPDGVEEIANETFYFCDNLVSVTIPDSVAYIGENAFWGCFDLTNVVLPEGIEEIGDGAFGNTGLMSIVIPDSLSYVGEKAFYSCDLVSVSIPDGITEIKDSTFYYCQDLVSIRIPASVKSIADDAFTACYDLAEIHGESGSFAETYAYEKGYRFIDETAISLDMTAAKLSKTALAPGDSVVISGIKVKNADYVHISGNNLHLKEEDIGEAAFDVRVINSKEDQTLDNITMVLSEETAVEGTFYISVQAFDDEEKSTYIDQSTLVYTVSYETVDMPALDMSDAELNKGIYNPGETVVISGIKVRNADRVHFSGNNTALTVTDIEVANSSEYQMMADVELTLSEDTSFGDFYISVQAFDNEGNASDIDQSTLKYRVAAEEEKLKWKASYDKYYTTITVKVVSGAPDENTDYLFVAENAKGKHHSGTIPAGKTTASFRIKDLQMPRAAKYDLYVLPDDVALTDENRSDYFVDDVVLPLWGGNMISAVYSGGADMTVSKTLYLEEDVEVVWEASYGVYNVEVAAALNGTTVFTQKYTDPALIDADKPVTTTIDSSLVSEAEVGDELEISVTVIPTDEAQALLAEAGKESTGSSSWPGTFVESYPRITYASIKDGDDVYDIVKGLQLVVGDHNYYSGYELVVETANDVESNWTVYTEHTDIARAYRAKDGKVYIHAKAAGTTALYISHEYSSDFATLNDRGLLYKVCYINVETPYHAIVIADPTYRLYYTDATQTQTAQGIVLREKDSDRMINSLNSLVFDNETSLNTVATPYTIKSYDGPTTVTYLRRACNQIAAKTSKHSVTFVYILCHGGLDGTLSFGLDNTATITPSDLKTMLDPIQGKVVVLLGSCFSGAMINDNACDWIYEYTDTVNIPVIGPIEIEQEMEVHTSQGVFTTDSKYHVITAANYDVSSKSPYDYTSFYVDANGDTIIGESVGDLFTTGICASIGSLDSGELTLEEVYTIANRYIVAYEDLHKEEHQNMQRWPQGDSMVIFQKAGE